MVDSTDLAILGAAGGALWLATRDGGSDEPIKLPDINVPEPAVPGAPGGGGLGGGLDLGGIDIPQTPLPDIRGIAGTITEGNLSSFELAAEQAEGLLDQAEEQVDQARDQVEDGVSDATDRPSFLPEVPELPDVSGGLGDLPDNVPGPGNDSGRNTDPHHGEYGNTIPQRIGHTMVHNPWANFARGFSTGRGFWGEIGNAAENNPLSHAAEDAVESADQYADNVQQTASDAVNEATSTATDTVDDTVEGAQNAVERGQDAVPDVLTESPQDLTEGVGLPDISMPDEGEGLAAKTADTINEKVGSSLDSSNTIDTGRDLSPTQKEGTPVPETDIDINGQSPNVSEPVGDSIDTTAIADQLDEETPDSGPFAMNVPGTSDERALEPGRGDPVQSAQDAAESMRNRLEVF